jgi:hypothetical protein
LELILNRTTFRMLFTAVVLARPPVSPGFVAMTSLWYKKDERESTFSSPFLTFSLSCSLSLSLAVLLAPANIDR